MNKSENPAQLNFIFCFSVGNSCIASSDLGFWQIHVAYYMSFPSSPVYIYSFLCPRSSNHKSLHFAEIQNPHINILLTHLNAMGAKTELGITKFLPKASALPSALARHRQLAPNASLLVSPLCLGTMNFGDAMKGHIGECTKEASFESKYFSRDRFHFTILLVRQRLMLRF